MWKICFILVLGLAVAGPVWADDPRMTIPEWKKLYPVEAMGPRLAGERVRATEPQLNVAASAQLDLLEAKLAESETRPRSRGGPYEYQSHAVRVFSRRRALEILHEEKTYRFLLEPGTGHNRFDAIQGRSENLQIPRAPLLTLSPAPLEPVSAVPRVERGLPLTDLAAAQTGSALPSREFLSRLHRAGQFDFVNDLGFGFRITKPEGFAEAGIEPARQKEVFMAGFTPHEFHQHLPINQPNLQRPAAKLESEFPQLRSDGSLPTDSWQIVRLELMSLLLHEPPGVYVSDALPKMEQLKNTRLRPLDSFERDALKELHAGEDLVTEDLTNNDIRIVGAVRATRQCLQCHKVARGTLLGAFSYRLRKVEASVQVFEHTRGYNRKLPADAWSTERIPSRVLAEELLRIAAQATSAGKSSSEWDIRKSTEWYVEVRYVPPRRLWIGESTLEVEVLLFNAGSHPKDLNVVAVHNREGRWGLGFGRDAAYYEKVQQEQSELWKQWLDIRYPPTSKP